MVSRVSQACCALTGSQQVSDFRKRERRHSRNLHRAFLLLAALCLLPPQFSYPQQAEIAAVSSTSPSAAIQLPKNIPLKRPVASEISVMGMVPDGDYQLFSATVRCTAWTVGLEYDRNSWGHLFGAQFDYVAEIFPFVLLSQPAVSDYWGNPKSPNQEHVRGLGISPFGMRFLWMSNHKIQPYAVGKIGAIAFTKKAFSQKAAYVNFNVQAALGFEIRLNRRMDLRVEPFEFFHVSNGYLATSNPGMDELATRYGITYHLGRHHPQNE